MPEHNPNAAPRTEHPEPEAIPFLMVVDCVASPEAMESGILPLATVVEDLRQALAAHTGLAAKTVHVSVRDARDDILHAIEAATDEETRRHG